MDAVYITGHRNPDTDSIVAAMAYAALKNSLGKREYRAARLRVELFDIDLTRAEVYKQVDRTVEWNLCRRCLVSARHQPHALRRLLRLLGHLRHLRLHLRHICLLRIHRRLSISSIWVISVSCHVHRLLVPGFSHKKRAPADHL